MVDVFQETEKYKILSYSSSVSEQIPLICGKFIYGEHLLRLSIVL